MKAQAAQPMLHGPLLPTLLRLATPNAIGLFANTVVIGWDGYIVGRLGPDALAGVAVVLPVAMLMLQMSAGALGGSTTAVVARALGAGDTPRAVRLAQHALMVGWLASLLFTLAFAWPLVYGLMGARQAVLAHASQYAAVLFSGAFAVWTINVLAGIARGAGDMKAAALALIATTVMHVGLSSVLVFGAAGLPPLGVAGAAASTVLCNAVSAVALLMWLSRRSSAVRVLGSAWRVRRDAFAQVLRLALPSALSPVLSNGSIALATAFMAGLGSLAVAGYGIAARLEYVLVPIAFGVGGALTAMVAANLGAGQVARARRVTWQGAALVCGITGAIGLVAALQPQWWMAMFTSDAAVQAAGAGYLRVVGGSYGFFGLGLALFFASQGAGRLAAPLMSSAARLLVVGVGGWMALHVLQAGTTSLYAVIALSLTVMGVALAWAVYRADWSSPVPA
ncbi:MAG: MATE family efflux transporter [Hydrogenophaga sp.]|uniref:MATE family efflux transporter n=1 Tax=Hydrogenophaga sp. TaxID=1904254 RepID=UPI001D338248|nr:MATE family efflux transporter [Hydrogenophaga sp.]MBX3610460.1 MATE family efflux transporter [Hydrogenophaga sp.]